MITLLLVVEPLLFAAAAFAAGTRRAVLRALLTGGAALHLILTLGCLLLERDTTAFRRRGVELLAADTTALVFLGITSVLFLLVAVHTLLWLPAANRCEYRTGNGGGSPRMLRENLYTGGLLAFLSMMSLVILARNFGLLWVAIEATTLVSAPLIAFHRSPGALEAMWKYLLICSVGIGFALFGTLMLANAGRCADGMILGLNIDTLLQFSNRLNPVWFKAAFIFALAGYGTKMGLAPFHTWLPDAHSEAPATVSALLSGALLNCSFLALIRFLEVAPVDLRGFCSELLGALGILSLATAAFFIIRQSDFKRMLAYSSVEHMGLAALLWSLGCVDYSLLHLCGHSLIKMMLFLVAGNLLLAYGTRSVAAVGELFATVPRNATVWLLGLFLICGTPPSPLFVTEYLLVAEAPLWLGATVLLLLFAVFCGMSQAFLRMAMGNCTNRQPENVPVRAAERLWPVPVFAALLTLAGGLVLTCLLNRGGL